MEVFALSTGAGIAVILGCIALVVIALIVVGGGVTRMYDRTRGGAGRRRKQPPQRVGRIWRIWGGSR